MSIGGYYGNYYGYGGYSSGYTWWPAGTPGPYQQPSTPVAGAASKWTLDAHLLREMQAEVARIQSAKKEEKKVAQDQIYLEIENALKNVRNFRVLVELRKEFGLPHEQDAETLRGWESKLKCLVAEEKEKRVQALKKKIEELKSREEKKEALEAELASLTAKV